MKKRMSPKAKVIEAAHCCVGCDTPVEVRGTRVKGKFGGYFLAEASANDVVLARSRDRDWRRAYKTLCIELMKQGDRR
ncbi:hypothetical protein EBZ70_11675 [bacterium]|nr:hypothetical protein [bacterium]